MNKIYVIESFDPETNKWSPLVSHTYTDEFYAKQAVGWLPTVNFYNKFRITK